MSSEKKPDSIVFNEDKQRYDAGLKSYATNVGAPVISIQDTSAWKNRSINKVNHKVRSRYAELKAEYEKMMTEFENNHLIFSSKFSFEPIIGQVYHLYERSNGETFLSLIAPDECSFKSIGSFYLNVDQIWEKL